MEESGKVIQSNQCWFNFYVKLPRVVAISIYLLFFIFGIIDAAARFILAEFFVIWWFIGVILAVLIYVGLKLIVCHAILQIYYLKDISEKLEQNPKTMK